MKKYALIGKKLGHSFSKDIHTRLGLSYEHIELPDEEQVRQVLNSGSYAGFNVTIPYKETVCKAVDELDPQAAEAGSVNTVSVRGGRLIGYNTDIAGMRYMLSSIGARVHGAKVLILGSGGTSKTAAALCRIDGAREYIVCSRKGDVNYANVYDRAGDAEIMINCTPVGMYPDNYSRPIDVGRLGALKFVADCVYNPLRTVLITDCSSAGIQAVNGLPMLVAQAVYAERIWGYDNISDGKIADICTDIGRSKTNIVLTGMPGCGKSTVGARLARALGVKHIDTDEVIDKTYSSPAGIISERGEGYFRKIESEVIRSVAAESGIVISTGGGSILAPSNVAALKQNGIIVYLRRSVDRLALGGRPLSLRDGVVKLYADRRPIYESTADVIVDNDADIDNTIEEITKIYENIGN